jgi:hypothetical protein
MQAHCSTHNTTFDHVKEGPLISLTKNLGMNTRVQDVDIKFWNWLSIEKDVLRGWNWNFIKDCTMQSFKFCDNIGKVNHGLESQTPPYLPNGDKLGKFYYTIGFTTLQNGEVGHLQIPKKNHNYVQMPM